MVLVFSESIYFVRKILQDEENKGVGLAVHPCNGSRAIEWGGRVRHRIQRPVPLAGRLSLRHPPRLQPGGGAVAPGGLPGGADMASSSFARSAFRTVIYFDATTTLENRSPNLNREAD